MEEERRWQIAEDGIRQIEKFIRGGEVNLVSTTFELTADGLVAFADPEQMSRLRKPAAAMDFRDALGAGQPVDKHEAVGPCRFGLG